MHRHPKSFCFTEVCKTSLGAHRQKLCPDASPCESPSESELPGQTGCEKYQLSVYPDEKNRICRSFISNVVWCMRRKPCPSAECHYKSILIKHLCNVTCLRSEERKTLHAPTWRLQFICRETCQEQASWAALRTLFQLVSGSSERYTCGEILGLPLVSIIHLSPKG